MQAVTLAGVEAHGVLSSGCSGGEQESLGLSCSKCQTKGGRELAWCRQTDESELGPVSRVTFPLRGDLLVTPGRQVSQGRCWPKERWALGSAMGRLEMHCSSLGGWELRGHRVCGPKHAQRKQNVPILRNETTQNKSASGDSFPVFGSEMGNF